MYCTYVRTRARALARLQHGETNEWTNVSDIRVCTFANGCLRFQKFGKIFRGVEMCASYTIYDMYPRSVRRFDPSMLRAAKNTMNERAVRVCLRSAEETLGDIKSYVYAHMQPAMDKKSFAQRETVIAVTKRRDTRMRV